MTGAQLLKYLKAMPKEVLDGQVTLQVCVRPGFYDDRGEYKSSKLTAVTTGHRDNEIKLS